MPLPDLLLGTRRLQRDIEAHAQQLERDISQVKFAGTQLRRTAVASVTSPIGLLSAAGLGFAVGNMTNRSSKPKSAHAKTHPHHHIEDAITFALSVARSLGLQILLPIAAGWLQSKLSQDKIEEELTNINETRQT